MAGDSPNECVPANPLVAAHMASLPKWRVALRRAVGARIAADARKKFDVRTRGMTEIDSSAVPIIAINHKTDDDPVVLLAGTFMVPALVPLFRCGAHALGAHVFQPGFLGGYVVKEPRWLSKILFHVNIGGVIRRLGAHPVEHARERYLRSHFDDVLALRGNLPLKDVLVGDVERFLPGSRPDARIRSVIRFRYRDALFRAYDFDILKPPLDELLWQHQQERIRTCVTTLARLADAGSVVVTAPEGMFTRDGTPERMRSGVYQIVNAMKEEAALVPINITYDPMGPDRRLAYFTVGNTVRLRRGVPREEFNAAISNALYRDAPVPLSQIAAETVRSIVLDGQLSVSPDTLRARMVERARELVRDGYAVLPDPEHQTQFDEGFDRFVAYCRKSGFPLREGVLQFDRDIVLDENIRKNGYARTWWYCFNELRARLAQPHGAFG